MFFVQQTDDYHYGLFRIESGNDAVPVLLASVETPTQLGQHDGYIPVKNVIATPDKVYYYALASVTDDGAYRRASYEMIQINKDGTGACPVDLGATEFQFIGIDGFNLYYESYSDNEIYCLDLISTQVTKISGFKEEVEKEFFGNKFGVYNGAFYYQDSESQGERYNTHYYSVDISSRERKHICSIEGRYPTEPLRFAEGYLFVYGLKDFGSPFFTMSVDLSSGETHLIAETEDYLAACDISVSRGSVYYIADDNTVYAADITGKNNRRLFGDEIFTGHEIGFSGIWAAGDWLYYKRLLEDYDAYSQLWFGKIGDVNICRIRLDGSFGPVSPIIR